MTDFPTVGLKVDLTGVDKGEQHAEKLKQTFQAVADKAAQASAAVTTGARKSTAANETVVKSNKTRAVSAEAAAKAEERAAQRAAKEAERVRKYLQSVRIRSIQMEEAARRAAEAEQARAMAKTVADQERAARQMEAAAKRVAKEQQKAAQDVQRAQERAQREALAAAEKADRARVQAAQRAAKEQEAIERGILSFRIRMRGQEYQEDKKANADILAFKQRMWAQQAREHAATQATMAKDAAAAAKAQEAADRKATAEQERLRKYLLAVKLQSFKWEAQAAAKAAAEDTRLARQAEQEKTRAVRAAAREQERIRRELARAVSGGGGFGGGSGGGIFDMFGNGPLRPFMAALGGLRTALAQTRRLFFDVRTAVGVFLGAMVVKPLITMSDAMVNLKARASAFADQGSDVPVIMEQLFQTAQKARVPLDAIAVLYTRLAPLSKELGKSQMELLRITETVAKGLTLGGATAEEAKASSQQLAQALASNRLGGDELRSLAENAPILMSKVAHALNMNTGQFIKWAHEGKANAKVVVDAISKAADDIDALFQRMPVTIGQATTLVKNAFENLIGQVNDATGMNEKIASVIAQFAGFLTARDTVEGMIKVVNGLTTALGYVGQAMHVVIDMLPAIATGVIGFAAAIALTRGWTALLRAQTVSMLALNAAVISGQVPASVLASRMTLASRATFMLGAAARATGAALATIFSPLNLIVIALTAAAAAYAYVKANSLTAQQAVDKFGDAVQSGTDAITRAISFLETYHADTKNFTDALLKLNGVTEDQVKGLDDAGRAAVARAENERTLTVALLNRAAAESTAAAAGLRRSATIDAVQQFGLETFAKYTPHSDATEKRRQAQVAALENKKRFSRSLADRLDENSGTLVKLADETRRAKLTVTTPDKAGPAQNPAAAGKGAKGFEGTMDRIEKLKDKLKGLREVFNTMSAEDPFSTWAAEIKQAGDEAAAAMEAGNKQNQTLANQARNLAEQVKQYELLNKVQQESLNNTRDMNRQAADTATRDAAALRSQEIMHDYMGQAVIDEESYLAALMASRDVLTQQEIAEARLAIARRYGVDSLDKISAAVVAAQTASGTAADEAARNGARAQQTAIAEAAAQENLIKVERKGNDAMSKRADVLDGIEKKYDRIFDQMSSMEERTRALGQSMADAFGAPGQAIADLLGIMDDYIRKETEVQKLRDVAAKDKSPDNLRRLAEAEQSLGETRLRSYGDMASAAKGFFEENSRGYALMTAAEKAFRFFEFAMSAKSIVLKTVETAAKVGLFGTQAAAAAQAGAAEMFAAMGPAGFAAVGAMVAVLAGLGLALSGGIGGGAYSGPTSDTRQAAQGSGSILGSASAKSESISKALEAVAANTNKDLEYSNEMARSLRSIDSQMSQLAASIARELGAGGGLDSQSLGAMGTTSSGGLRQLSSIGGILRAIAYPITLAFSKSVTKSLNDQGIRFNSGTLGDIAKGGASGNFFQEVLTETKKKFLGITYSDKTSLQTSTSPIGSDLSRQIGLILESLAKGVSSAAEALGKTGGMEMLKGFVIALGDMSFKDMDGEAISKAIENMLSKVGDDMATYLVPEIAQFQKAGEGLFETLVRVAREYQVLDVALSSIGKQFGAVGIASLGARERLIELAGGIDNLTDQIATYADKFLTDAEKIAPIQAAVSKQMGELGLAGITTKDAFKQVVSGLDLTTVRGQEVFAAMMELAPAFAQVADYADKAAQAVVDAAKAKDDEAQSRLEKANKDADAAKEALQRAYDAVMGPAQEALSKAQTDAAAARQGLIDSYNAEVQAIKDRQAAAAQKTADAQSAVITAYQRESGALTDLARRMKDFGASIRDFRQQLLTGALSTGTPSAKYGAAKGRFLEVKAVLAADPKNEDALSKLQEVAQAFLDASEAFSPTKEAYTQDFADVLTTLAASANGADSQANLAQSQLDALNQQLDLLDGVLNGIVTLGATTLTMKDGVFQTSDNTTTVAQAISALQTALVNQAAVDTTAASQLSTLNSLFAKAGLIRGDTLYIGDQVFKLNSEGIYTLDGGLTDVRTAVDNVQIAMAEVAKAQAVVDAINTQLKDLGYTVVNGLVTKIGDNTNAALSIAEAVGNLETALSEQSAAKAAAEITAADLLRITAQAASDAADKARLAAEAAAAALAAMSAANTNVPPTTTPTTTTGSSGAWTAEGYLSKNADVLAEGQRLLAVADRNSPWFNQHYLNEGVNGYARWHWENYGQQEHRAFAMGGAFSNGIVRSPTMFNMGEMGEGGTPEGILPLTNVGGRLGVHAVTGDNDDIVNELRQMKDQLEWIKGATVGTAKNTSNTDRIQRKWDADGMPDVRSVA